MEARSVREQIALLAAARRAILGELGQAAGFRLFHLSQVLSAVDRAIRAGRARAEALIAGTARDTWRLGDRLVDVALKAEAAGLYSVSSSLLGAAVDVTSDQIRAIWSELGTRLKVAIRRAALGIDDPFQSIQAVARVIRDPKTFRSAVARAEAIVRTELNRIFNTATQKRLEVSDQRMGGGLKKWWLTAEDQRVRPDHATAGRRYGRAGAIPVGKPFLVGGVAMMQPHDPGAPAGQVVNCRCRSIPLVPGL